MLKDTPSKDNENIKLLNYIYQNAKMGSENITQLLSKINDSQFKSTLTEQLSKYQDFVNKTTNMIIDMNTTPEESTLSNLRSKTGIMFNTLTNTSTSHIAEMMITGSTMGVIDMTKKLKQHSNCKSDINNLGNNLLQFEENNINNLKQFL